MNWYDYVLICVSTVCTVCSGFGAWKSNSYYKKSKQLTLYTNNNIAYTESQKIIATLTQLLELGGSRKVRGINYSKQVTQHAVNIKLSITKIRESLTVDDYNDIKKHLNSNLFNAEEYIDSIIGNQEKNEETFTIDTAFTLCQNEFNKIQLVIKKKIEDVSEKIK